MGDESCFSPAVSWVFCLRCDQLLTVFVFNWANGTSLTRSFRLPTSEFGLLCSVNWENNHFCVLSRLVSPKHEHESFPKTYLSWANPALVHMWTTLSKSQMPSRLSLFWARFTHECFFLREDPNVFIEASPREHKEATLGGGGMVQCAQLLFMNKHNNPKRGFSCRAKAKWWETKRVRATWIIYFGALLDRKIVGLGTRQRKTICHVRGWAEVCKYPAKELVMVRKTPLELKFWT